MQISNLPANKFSIPFASAAGAGFINVIPEASQIGITNGAASLTDGFPPLNFLPVGSGGVPPFGQDMNGILKEISAWTQWQNAGGLVPYDATFSTAIGGYPQSAVLAGTTAGAVWLSTVDNNVTNPNTGGAGWVLLTTSSGIQNNQYTYAVAGGTANALTATLAPVPSAVISGAIINLKITTTNTGAATLNVNGTGVISIVNPAGGAMAAGDLPAGSVIAFLATGTSWMMIGASQSQIQSASAGNGQAFTASGTFVVPAGVTRLKVKLVGGGGGGAGGGGVNGFSGGGGAAGGYAEGYLAVTPGASITATVGAGASAGGGTTGGTGGTTSFSSISATGGGGGTGSAGSCPGGTGGLGAGGYFNIRGGDGGDGNGVFSSGQQIQGGNGGASFFGGGGRTGSVNGVTAVCPGAGGGAAWGSSSGTGGGGANGCILVEY